MVKPTIKSDQTERIAILVVHGVGEQKRFEHLEAIAANLYKALNRKGSRYKTPKGEESLSPVIQIRYGEETPHLSPEHTWRKAPVLVRWRKADGKWIEAEFREVHWADLDMAKTLPRWLRLVGWALGVAGVRMYRRAKSGAPEEHGMRSPRPLGLFGRLAVRLQLLLVSLLFFILLITLNLINGLLKRAAIRVGPLDRATTLIYNYLGDVKLYQDWFWRTDEHVECIGEKSRVAIRRRMVRALTELATAKDIERYYIFAHSLGTVVAFNGLMESAFSLPNYLTKEEWQSLPNNLKGKAVKAFKKPQMPSRRPWLDTLEGRKNPGKNLPRDLIKRDVLFSKLKGFLTLGSPLDKFATLWPAIVPINGSPMKKGKTIPWYNVADVQDIVAGELNRFKKSKSTPAIGGLELINYSWADQRSLFTAHTSYWKAAPGKKRRLIDSIIPWIEQERGKLQAPDNRLPSFLAKLIYPLSLVALGSILLWSLATLIRLIINKLFTDLASLKPLAMLYNWFAELTGAGLYFTETTAIALILLLICLVVVVSAAVLRWLWETIKFHEANSI